MLLLYMFLYIVVVLLSSCCVWSHAVLGVACVIGGAPIVIFSPCGKSFIACRRNFYGNTTKALSQSDESFAASRQRRKCFIIIMCVFIFSL